MENLDDILNDVDETPIEAEAPAEVAGEAESENVKPRDENGRFTKSEPPSQLPPEEFKGLKEERAKRQALEREIEALKHQIQPPAPAPSIFEDEQGAFQHFGAQVVSTAVQQANLNARLDMSEMMVRQAHPDFEEVKAEFLALAEANPILAEQARADPHPWQKAYQIAKTHRTMQEVGATDVDTLRAKIREEIMAEMQGQPRSAIPPTLTGVGNVGVRNGPAWSGPKPLSDLLA